MFRRGTRRPDANLKEYKPSVSGRRRSRPAEPPPSRVSLIIMRTDQAHTHPLEDPQHVADLLRRELGDALIHPGIIPCPNRTVMILTHDEAARLLRILQSANQQPW